VGRLIRVAADPEMAIIIGLPCVLRAQEENSWFVCGSRHVSFLRC